MNSQARAACQSRSTVASEIPRASPVSSSDRPPKNRSSAIWLFRGSNAASCGQRGIEIQDVDICRRRHDSERVQRDARPLPGSFGPPPRAGAIDEDAAHHLRGDAEELRPVVPGGALIDQPQVGLVDEGGRLQGVALALAPQMGRGPAAKLLVDQRHEPIARARVAVAPRVEKRCDVVSGTAQIVLGNGSFCSLDRGASSRQ